MKSEEKKMVVLSFEGRTYDDYVFSAEITVEEENVAEMQKRIENRLPLLTADDIRRFPELLYKKGH